MSALYRWINSEIGFVVTPETQGNIQQALVETAYHMGVTTEELTQGLLSNQIAPAPFIERVVTNESFFFRYQSQMTCVINDVVQPMIKKGKTPRILSLPCAAGEEAFSFAMLSQSNGVNLDNIRIFGVDISTQCIQKAQSGIYTEYDFRRTSAEYQQRYFTAIGDKRYQLSDRIRRSVEFYAHNIFNGLDKVSASFDVIFFNNLLIYLDEAHTRDALNILRKHLSPDGWMIVDSTEAPRCREVFASQVLGDFFVFRHKEIVTESKKKNHGLKAKPSSISRQSISKQSISKQPMPRWEPPQSTNDKKAELLRQAKAAADDKHYSKAISLYQRFQTEFPSDALKALYALGQLYANQGQDLHAMETAEQALVENDKKAAINSLSKKEQADLHAILALGLRSKGLRDAAQQELSKVLSLYPQHPLGKIYHQEDER